MLARAPAEGGLSVRQAVRLSVCHTREARLNGTRFRKAFRAPHDKATFLVS